MDNEKREELAKEFLGKLESLNQHLIENVPFLEKRKDSNRFHVGDNMHLCFKVKGEPPMKIMEIVWTPGETIIIGPDRTDRDEMSEMVKDEIQKWWVEVRDNKAQLKHFQIV